MIYLLKLASNEVYFKKISNFNSPRNKFDLFFLIRLIPGDPVLNLAGERGIDPAKYLEMKKALGLDLPIISQFWIFLKMHYKVIWERALYLIILYGQNS